MTTYNATPQNIALLAALLRYEPVVAEGWLRLEGQQVPNPTNPLNVKWWGRPPQIGQLVAPYGTFGRYQTPADGLRDAVALLHDMAGEAWTHYADILAQSGSGDALAQAAAIEASAWAGGYGGQISAWVTAHWSAREPMLNLSGYNPTSTQSVALPQSAPLFAHPGDAAPLVRLSAPATVAVLGRVQAPPGWYLVRVNTAAGWADGVRRLTGCYAQLDPRQFTTAAAEDPSV